MVRPHRFGLFSEEGAEMLVDFDFDHGKRITRVSAGRSDGGGVGVWGDDALLGG